MPDQALKPKLWSVEETAQLLNLHWQTVRKLIRNGDLVPTRIGDRVMVRDDELERFIDAHTQTGADDAPA